MDMSLDKHKTAAPTSEQLDLKWIVLVRGISKGRNKAYPAKQVYGNLVLEDISEVGEAVLVLHPHKYLY